MEYEEYLDKFCSNKTSWKRTGDTHSMGLPLRIRFLIWRLKRKGYLVRVTVDYHYQSVDCEKEAKKGRGYGFVRIHKYKPKMDIPIGLEIEEGNIGD